MFEKFLKKKKKPIIKPRFKIGEKCIWYDYNATDNIVTIYDYVHIVTIYDYVIDGNVVNYIVIDLDTDIMYEWITENELYKL